MAHDDIFHKMKANSVIKEVGYKDTPAYKKEKHESKFQEKKEHMAKKILKPEKKEHAHMFRENGERWSK